MQYTHATSPYYGALLHTVHTEHHALAYRIYEEALQLDIEPELTPTRTGYAIEFVADQNDALTALLTASTDVKAEVLV